MAGVYIPGMEMPTSCSECVAGFGGGCHFGTSYDEYMCPKNGRASWCPLVFVPDHGRLIDADALLAENYEGDANPGWIKSAAIITPQLVSNLPTIIPADEED